MISLWNVLSYPIGLCLWVWSELVTRTSTVRVAGPGVAYEGPAVYVNWHKHLPYLIAHHGGHGRWMLVSGASYMQPIARWCALSGLRLVRGASGENIRESLRLAQELLMQGQAIVIAVDGPSGPAFKVKRGCVGMAKTAGCPIIPVAYRCKRGRPSARRWDRSLRPALFDEILIEYGEPIAVRDESEEHRILSEVGNGLDRLGK